MSKSCFAVVTSIVLCMIAGSGAMGQTKPSQLDTVKIVGPSLAKGLLDDLGLEYHRNKHSIALDFQRNETHSGAAGALLQDRDLMVSLGPVTPKSLGSVGERWAADRPECNILGGRGMAIVVHINNTVDSLTLEQIQSVFSGRTSQWKLLGAQDKPIRCYGLELPDPYARLFNDKVLPQHKWGTIFKKKKSQDVLKAISADPTGIGFVNSADTIAFGDSIKILGIGSADKATYLNPQTLKDGTYPFCEVLFLYTSPKSNDTARDFVQYAMSGDCDAVFLKSDYMPGLRSLRADVVATFAQLYGDSIAKAKSTTEEDDDLTLGKLLLNAAKNTRSLDPDLRLLMITSCFDLCQKIQSAEPLVLDAMKYMAEAYPERKLEACQKLAQMYDGFYVKTPTPEQAEILIDVLMNCVELAVLAKQPKDASVAAQRAAEVAKLANSPKSDYIKARLAPILAREQSAKEIESLRNALRANPSDAATRAKLLRLCLIERDAASEAARLMDVSTEPTLRTNIPLAVAKMETLSKEAVLKLAEWYLALADDASAGGKELMLRRSREYYMRFMSMHSAKDEMATRSDLGFQKCRTMLRSMCPESPVMAMPIEVAGEEGWLDVFALVDVKRDAKEGAWVRKDKFLKSIDAISPLNLPVTCEGSYEISIGMSFEHPPCMGVVLPIGDEKTAFIIGAGGQNKKSYCGVTADNMEHNEEDDIKKFNLVPVGSIIGDGRDHTLNIRISMAKDMLRVAATLDGKPYYQWEGTAEAAKTSPRLLTKEPKVPGMFTYGGPQVTISKIKIRGAKVEATAFTPVKN